MATWPELFRALEETAKPLSFEKRESISEQLPAELQSQGAKSFDESWQNLLGAIETKGKELSAPSRRRAVGRAFEPPMLDTWQGSTVQRSRSNTGNVSRSSEGAISGASLNRVIPKRWNT